MSERELFEAWHTKEYSDKLEWCEIKQEYKDFIDEAMWQAWQASANRQGYKLVPVNYECVWCGCTELGGWADEAMIGACDD